MARDIWSSIDDSLLKSCQHLDVESRFKYCIRKDEYVFCSTLWWIWRDRNNLIFNPLDKWTPAKVRSLCIASSKELKSVQQLQPAILPTSLISDWNPPHDSRFKVNYDASVNENSQLAGFRCVIRDSLGKWIKSCNGTLPFGSVLRCEFFAIWRGLILIWKCGIRDLICETDCLHGLLAIRTLEPFDTAVDKDLLLKIHEVTQWSWKVEFSLIQRTANNAADYLTKQASASMRKYTE
ncbi:hypothetical protein PIB30_053755 [Stylosanthes scabra]|uniref:RNase H type-1 domain-containing protein n=1 Tax=Stylosanthes scabra TaxID=79078 RepID=A0ABU6SJ55_9FABA|nr:hypothetical protein [Stylosanthes scabra]